MLRFISHPNMFSIIKIKKTLKSQYIESYNPIFYVR